MKILLNRNIEKDTLELYLRNIVEQYKKSTGVNNLPNNKEIIKKEINSWLKERQSLMRTYKDLLNCMNIEYNHKMTAEIGKGIHDTICYDKDTTLITPYTYRLDNRIKNKLIKARIQIINDNQNRVTSQLTKIDHLMTENPYQKEDIYNWEYIFNNTNIDATIGIYGKVYDKDRLTKIKMLEDFKEKIQGNYKESSYRVKDEYGMVITKAKTKCK